MSTWKERLVSTQLRARLRELEGQDAEVRVLGFLLGEIKRFEWALSIGTLRDPVLRGLAPPIPPAGLRNITANESPEEFLWTGLVDVHGFLDLHDRYRDPSATGARARVLDFGCGCGRLLRFLRAHEDLFELHGTDVNDEHIGWCRENLAPISFSTNGPGPPLPHGDGAFDLIWSLSVFTHLDEPLGEAWRRDLARVLSTAGVLIMTVHGNTARERIAAEGELAARFGLDAELQARIGRSIEESGYAFVPYGSRDLETAKAGETYGLHFTCESHVRERWTVAGLELAAYLPGALRGWQDVVVFKRR